MGLYSFLTSYYIIPNRYGIHSCRVDTACLKKCNVLNGTMVYEYVSIYLFVPESEMRRQTVALKPFKHLITDSEYTLLRYILLSYSSKLGESVVLGFVARNINLRAVSPAKIFRQNLKQDFYQQPRSTADSAVDCIRP